MALSPALAFTKIGHGPNTLELYLDLVCPFSRKITLALATTLIPTLLDPSTPLSQALTLLIRPYPQPWHASGTYTSEAAIAFGKLSYVTKEKEPNTGLWWKFWVKLMEEQERFFDNPVKSKTPEAVRDELAQLAGEVLEKEGAVKGPASRAVGEVRELVGVKGSSPNAGTAVTDDLKYFVKLGRQNGIHVTPSAVFNGIFDSSVSSSWGDKEWNEFFKSKGLPGF